MNLIDSADTEQWKWLPPARLPLVAGFARADISSFDTSYAFPFSVVNWISQRYAVRAAMDDSVGAVEQVLERNGLLDDTLVIFPGGKWISPGKEGLADKLVRHEPSIRAACWRPGQDTYPRASYAKIWP
jgi:hypothetical protein